MISIYRLLKSMVWWLPIASLSLYLVSCGDVPSSFCTPNVKSQNIDLRVYYIPGSDLKYGFEVCRASESLRAVRYSVYGVTSESQIDTINLNTSVRLNNVYDGLRTGDVFEVDFRSGSGDVWFVIFEDDGISLSSQNEIARGNLSLFF